MNADEDASINADNDREMTLTQVANSLPGRTCNRKVLRWIRYGIWTGPRKARHKVYLPARKVGGMWFVAETALADFIKAITPQPKPPAPPRLSRKLQRQAERKRRRRDEYLRSEGLI